MREVSISEVWAKKYPERVVIALTCDEKGKVNLIPLGWCMQTSFNPPLIAISVGITRYSHRLLEKTGEFVLSFPNKNMGKEVYFCGTHSGKDTDKLKETGLKTRPAKFIRPPLLAECPINLECKVVNSLRTGDHTIFVGRILAAYVEKKEEILLNYGNYQFGGIKEPEILFSLD